MRLITDEQTISIDEHASGESDKNRYNFRELSGSLGDLGTFLPLAVSMSLICGLDIAVVFLFAGLMNVATGWYFRQPIPVQPMKAIAAVAIAEGLGVGEIAAAGMLMGVILFVMALGGGVDWVTGRVPKAIVRGIQLGVGVKLAIKGVMMIWILPIQAIDGWMTAFVVAGLILLIRVRWLPIMLMVFIGGMVIMLITKNGLFESYGWGLPHVRWVWPNSEAWWTGLTKGAIPQLPLTLLNSVIAVCALSADYYPGKRISEKKMAMSVGLMNLVCVPFGGMPACHGSGGLAAQYRFGARTGGSVIMLGGLKILAAVTLGSVLMGFVQAYPVSILAVALVYAGMALAWTAKDAMKRRLIAATMATGLIIVAYGTLWGVLGGFVVYGVTEWLLSRKK
ncbi:putative sulfate/molybdate transporter [Poriferisphaera corsica]|nr:putative sulfate/molybdate transporter [Poriferisphaera corsica]